MRATGPDLTGQVFSRLTVLKLAEVRHEKRMWECLCECGKTAIVATGDRRAGRTKSCGNHRTGRQSHGGSDKPEYQSWLGMKARCSNPKHFAYDYYGGRGIDVCDRWKNSFENFLADLGPRPTKDHTLERNDVDGNYDPGNCRWATRLEQNKNRRPRKQKTHCKRGHPLSDDNVVVDAGGRKCLTCRKILWQQWSSRNPKRGRAA